MNSRPAIRPGWTIARALWLANRWGFVSLLSAALVCAFGFRVSGVTLRDGDALHVLSNLAMGLSLFLTFVFCNFTEADRRERLAGFPARLFTLPVPTRTLVAAPILFGVVAVSLVYAAWARLALATLGRELSLGVPILYLSTGMVCYHAIVWSLARFRIARLLVLGIGGTTLAVGWLAFRNDSRLLPISDPLLCAVLAAVGGIAFLIAGVAVESQRRGEGGESRLWRTCIEFTTDRLPRRQRRLSSPGQAQLWFEWRRHGMVLPLSIAGVLLAIMAPGPLFRPISASTTTLVLDWVLLLPLLLAWALGKAFGKADVWSSKPGLPIFFATRPLSNGEWIGAKMKAAALAAATSWLVVAILTSLWLWQCCDCKALVNLWRIAESIYPPPVLCAWPALVFGVLVILTWRLLAGSLYIGLFGKSWLLTTAACGVFTAILGAPFVSMALTRHPAILQYLLKLPAWFPWLLAGLFVAKVIASFLLTEHAHRQGWIASRSLMRYLALWIAATAFLLLAIWLLIPVEGWFKWLAMLLGLFAVPLLRVACAPIALAHNRRC